MLPCATTAAAARTVDALARVGVVDHSDWQNVQVRKSAALWCCGADSSLRTAASATCLVYVRRKAGGQRTQLPSLLKRKWIDQCRLHWLLRMRFCRGSALARTRSAAAAVRPPAAACSARLADELGVLDRDGELLLNPGREGACADWRRRKCQGDARSARAECMPRDGRSYAARSGRARGPGQRAAETPAGAGACAPL